MTKLRFHWMLPKGGEVDQSGRQTPQAAARYRAAATSGNSAAARVDMEGWTSFALRAEAAGIESVLISLSPCEPDPLVISCALGLAVKQLRFIVAYRSGLIMPTSFVQQVNSLAALIEGRIALNIVAGSSSQEQHGYGDFLTHDERYERAQEFVAVCNAFWRRQGDVNFKGVYYEIEQGMLNTPFVAPQRTAPEIYISGHSENAERLALAQGTCLLRVAAAPETLRAAVQRLRIQGLEVCLRMCVLCRPTRAEAFSVAQSLIPQGASENHVTIRDDSQMYREGAAVAHKTDHWLTPSLWTGLVPSFGPVWTTLLGTPAEVAGALMEYKQIGVTQFILSGWPEVDELTVFGREVLPLIRRAEMQQG